jgi:hypothetical protein
VRQILQRTHLVLRQRALAADVQNRALGAERGRDAGHRIGAAGAGGGDHAAELAGLARVAVGGVRRDLLVAHVDDADALIDAAIVDVDDVAAAQREDRVDALVLERLGHQVAARDHAGVAALALQGVLGGGGLGLSLLRGLAVAMFASNFGVVKRSPRAAGSGPLQWHSVPVQRVVHAARCGRGLGSAGLGEMPTRIGFSTNSASEAPRSR